MLALNNMNYNTQSHISQQGQHSQYHGNLENETSRIRLPSISSLTNSSSSRINSPINFPQQHQPQSQSQPQPTMNRLQQSADLFINAANPLPQLPAHSNSQPKIQTISQSTAQHQHTQPLPSLTPLTSIHQQSSLQRSPLKSSQSLPRTVETHPQQPLSGLSFNQAQYPYTSVSQSSPKYSPSYNRYQKKAKVSIKKIHKISHENKKKQNLSCQRCGITETPEWRKGPNGARTLCNACGLYHAKVLKKEGPEAAKAIINDYDDKKRKKSNFADRKLSLPSDLSFVQQREVQHPDLKIAHHPIPKVNQHSNNAQPPPQPYYQYPAHYPISASGSNPPLSIHPQAPPLNHTPAPPFNHTPAPPFNHTPAPSFNHTQAFLINHTYPHRLHTERQESSSHQLQRSPSIHVVSHVNHGPPATSNLMPIQPAHHISPSSHPHVQNPNQTAQAQAQGYTFEGYKRPSQ
ncbi:hypothetical protein WICMUC_000559 [Wickerhamomyces mucosus]|uniref:GATA-type domain-containing protein n=1 Tax=Wickerhamomyces mucosus TaxID=1378264 RepID=A0A9P8TII9_9ASCO|nr:hypothetical protein WICMUC_000559 [Wickerhamomyces mucosus]